MSVNCYALRVMSKLQNFDLANTSETCLQKVSVFAGADFTPVHDLRVTKRNKVHMLCLADYASVISQSIICCPVNRVQRCCYTHIVHEILTYFALLMQCSNTSDAMHQHPVVSL